MLSGLGGYSESRYFAKQQGWKYPASREFLALGDLIDLMHMINLDKKNRNKFKHYEKPFAVNEAIEKIVTKGTALSVAEALKRYRPKVSTKTPEEIAEANEKFLREEKKG